MGRRVRAASLGIGHGTGKFIMLDSKRGKPHEFGTLLFDNAHDPRQQRPLDDPAIEKMMIEHIVREMKKNDAPPEQYERLGLAE